MKKSSQKKEPDEQITRPQSLHYENDYDTNQIHMTKYIGQNI